MKLIKQILFIIKNYTKGYIIKVLSWLHCRYADYLAETNRHYYHVFRIKWTFKILNVKEIDHRKKEGMRYYKRKLRNRFAKMTYTIDYEKHCIYVARPKTN